MLLADVVGDAGEERGTKRGCATGEDEIEETMEFPQHKSSIVTASGRHRARDGSRAGVHRGQVRRHGQGPRHRREARHPGHGRAGDRREARDAGEARRQRREPRARGGRRRRASVRVRQEEAARAADGHDANGKRDRRRIKPEFDWRHSGAGWDNGGLSAAKARSDRTAPGDEPIGWATPERVSGVSVRLVVEIIISTSS